LIAEGSSKLASVPSGGAAPAASSGGAAAAGGAAEPAAEEKKEEAKEGEFTYSRHHQELDREHKADVYVHAFRCCWSLRAESDDDMGFGLFD